MHYTSLKQEGWLELDITVTTIVPIQPVINWMNENLGQSYGTMAAEMYADDWEFGYRIVNGDFHYVVRFATEEILKRFQDHFGYYGRH